MIYQEVQLEGGGCHPAAQEREEVKCKDGTYGNCTEYAVAPPLRRKRCGECR